MTHTEPEIVPADDDVLDLAARWRAEGRDVALATVVGTWGSSPRPVGSQLVVDDAGAFRGSVSGGCIEAAVVHEARQVIADGKPRLLAYGVSNEQAWEVGLACGGTVEIYVERIE
ncbi:MAG: XdhC family protein [Alphaproteobacteria bacterium]